MSATNRYSPNLRASWHDYDGGMYFVTFCTREKEPYFGDISDGKMNLTEIGVYANEQFSNVSAHYPYSEIPLWVVMPNHIHAIVVIHGKIDVDSCRVVARNDATNDTTNSTTKSPKEEYMSSLAPKRNTLPVVIRGLKSAITKYANNHSIPFAWQSKYYDRIIRDNEELNRISDYIENNIAQWDYDNKSDHK